MAFNFNWSPLTADAGFYERARDLLTTALNKSPKPPIIVDDIFVTEFNLGSVPPDLEILEIGDLAEDRFRGIFKMCYSGDAFLTLATRVQANPLNTYISAKPGFTSPEPLTASSSLTIPLQITLSEIKLSAFIILVFSKQKGLTIVFRNDPLESLKVSSTFDSIQFVRDYLQKTIEAKLRDLIMDELPAIIHRLSLQLWCPDQVQKEEDEAKEESDAAINPLATPPLDAVDAHGHRLDPVEISSLSLDGGPETQSLFSQKNLEKMDALANAHRTSSLMTPNIIEVVFRAWAGQSDKADPTATPSASTPNLHRTSSYQGSVHTYTFSDNISQASGHAPSRPTLVSMGSATTGLSLGSGRHSKAGRKKKMRVVNLRSKTAASEPVSEVGSTSSQAGDSSSEAASTRAPMSEPVIPTTIREAPGDDLAASQSKVRFRPATDATASPRASEPSGSRAAVPSVPVTAQPSRVASPQEHVYTRQPSMFPSSPAPQTSAQEMPPLYSSRVPEKAETTAPIYADTKAQQQQQWGRAGPQPDMSSVILEQAWITKIAGEIARRVYDEKNRNPAFWEDSHQHDIPPPAYEPR
ncbi:hypothetical protein QBC32DRAFT_116021 [Pseudoneurospora amorphoporcata]|uniref:Mitochondrial distribution and morphology protein 34 n=1 Tax=Pseudoneurospora amorphoporcata TaxID=241081 RepID=A0AAN6NYQ1_9PEZI|nr:hypothetical protein QBC32DRAFT_116021 [Pseudoneurospora amorphoporcata]